ncbi:MAG: hypothetical protein OJF47_003052 [Nitrospira sp.]|jgi:hypothetical protein|nr:MAG: hypothetical protein OJF47_003052 [Nitrospira sp.]
MSGPAPTDARLATLAHKLSRAERLSLERLAEAFLLKQERISIHLMNQIELLVDIAHGRLLMPPMSPKAEGRDR